MGAFGGIFVLVICHLLCAQAGSLNFVQSGVIKKDVPFVLTPPLVNLHTDAILEVTYNKNLVLCVQEKYELPHWTEYNYATCTYFYRLDLEGEKRAIKLSPTTDLTQDLHEASLNGTWPLLPSAPSSSAHSSPSVPSAPIPHIPDNTTVTIYLPLRFSRHFVGIYFPTQVLTNTYEAMVLFKLTGDYCDLAGTFWDGVSCVGAKEIPGLGASFSADLAPARVNLFLLHVSDLTAYISVDVPGLPSTSKVWLRWEATPSYYNYDAFGLGSEAARFSLPRPGLWIVGIYYGDSGGNVTKTINVLGKVCPNPLLAGPTCSTPVLPAVNNMTEIVATSEYLYYTFTATPDIPLYISITTLNQKDIPMMYASLGQLPKLGNSDISNCNQDYCDLVKTIRVDVGSVNIQQTWYIGVTLEAPPTPPVRQKNVTFGLWFNSTCVPGCESFKRGTCEDSGLCSCFIDYMGIDCGIFRGSGAQYKVMTIVLAILFVVMLVAIVLLWLRARRNAQNGYAVI